MVFLELGIGFFKERSERLSVLQFAEVVEQAAPSQVDSILIEKLLLVLAMSARSIQPKCHEKLLCVCLNDPCRRAPIPPDAEPIGAHA